VKLVSYHELTRGVPVSPSLFDDNEVSGLLVKPRTVVKPRTAMPLTRTCLRLVRFSTCLEFLNTLFLLCASL
jgi:hypothetical protein